MCDWVDWAGYRSGNEHGLRGRRGNHRISAGDADAFSVYKILDGETKLNYRAEQGYIYPCKRPCNHVSEGSCTRGCVSTADHFA